MLNFDFRRSQQVDKELVFDFQPTPENTIKPYSIYSTRFGNTILKWTEFVRPRSIDDAVIGNVLVTIPAQIGIFDFKNLKPYTPNNTIVFNFYNTDNQITAFGFDPSVFGDTSIRHAWQKLEVFGIGGQTIIGNPAIRHKQITPKSLGDGLKFGVPSVIIPTFVPNFNFKNSGVYYVAYPIIFDFSAKENQLVAIGFNSLQVGLASVSLNQSIEIKGIYPPNLGLPVVINRNQEVKTGNLFDGDKFGNATIFLAEQYVRPQGLVATLFGTHWLSHYVREVITVGKEQGAIGQAWISHAIRFVRPDGIWGDKGKDFASDHLVGGTQFIHPDGYVATQWLTRIIPENQVIGIEKGINGECGTPAIVNHTQYLNAKGFGNNDGSAEMVRFGHANIFNLTQQITQYFIADSGLVPQVIDPDDPNSQSDFGRWTTIVNRNKTIATFGVDSSRFGYQQIQNKAVPVLPVPIMNEVGKPMIAYRVRTLAFDGIEPPHFSYWHIIRNTARVLKPNGFDSSDYGKPAVASNKQFIKQIFPFENSDIGTPMMADRVRTIDIEWRYSIAPPTIALPTIENYTRYIAPKGFDGTDGYKRKFGRAELMERFNIIRTHGRTHDEFGLEVIIRNLTPELRVFGYNSNEFGETAIRNEWREVLPFGNQMSAVGTPIIKDRKQTIRVDGVNGNNFGWHFVKKGIAPPYSTQYIELRKFDNKGIEKDGFGIGYPSGQVPIANVRTNIIRPAGIQSQQFGKTSLTANSIRIDSGIFELLVGSPKVWIKQQYIKPKGLDCYVNEDKMGKPQLSPHTIYAPSGENATEQARRNHSSHYEQKPIDSLVFGRTVISNQHRAIFQYHQRGDMQVFGQASIGNKDQVIKPRGFRGGYFGWHIIPFVPQAVEQFSDKPHKTAFGTHTIGFIGEQQNSIRAGALVSMQFGDAHVSHFHRAIYPQDFVATQMGQSRYDDTPFMWQGLRIGERVFGNYGGFDSTVFGVTWISNKIREVRAEGFDSFVSETDIRSFKGKLTVKRAIDGMPKKGKKVQILETHSITRNDNQIPSPDIKNKVQYIQPDGNSEQFRKGAW